MATPSTTLAASRAGALPSWSPLGAVTRFADRLVAHELPALPVERRSAAVAFAARRVAGLPSPMALGVTVVAGAVDAMTRLGGQRVVRLIATRPLPVLGEYARLVRSLTTAYIWETWPRTAADGRDADGRDT